MANSGARTLRDIKDNAVLAALDRAGGRRHVAAAELGLAPSTFYRMLAVVRRTRPVPASPKQEPCSCASCARQRATARKLRADNRRLRTEAQSLKACRTRALWLLDRHIAAGLVRDEPDDVFRELRDALTPGAAHAER